MTKDQNHSRRADAGWKDLLHPSIGETEALQGTPLPASLHDAVCTYGKGGGVQRWPATTTG